MREFVNRPDAYVLGRDCRAFPPISLAHYHSQAPQTQPSSASTGRRQLPPVTDSRWPAVTSPGNHGSRQEQVRGPWRTPDALDTPRDRATYRDTGNGMYPSQVLGQRRGLGQYQEQAVTDDSGHPAGYTRAERAGAGSTAWHQNSSDSAELNRTTSDDHPATKFVTFSSWLDDNQQHLSAANSQTSDVNSASRRAGQLPQTDHTPTTSGVDDRLRDQRNFNRPSERPLATRTLTTTSGVFSGPLTSTPIDYNAPVGN